MIIQAIIQIHINEKQRLDVSSIINHIKDLEVLTIRLFKGKMSKKVQAKQIPTVKV